MSQAESIRRCRVCESGDLEPVLDLGRMALTGYFPRPGESVETLPILLVRCTRCDLFQLGHAFPADMLYGEHYGYRSGLNRSMIRHLTRLAERGSEIVGLEPGDLVIDIGSNDGTLLGAIPEHCERLGVDPSAARWASRYPHNARLLPEFFTGERVRAVTNRPARLVTSIAMFYDLANPIAFARDVASLLAEDGAWIIEVAYLPTMFRHGIYDGICHEHTEYYGLVQLRAILDAVGLVILDASLNDVNGGSVQVVAGHRSSAIRGNAVQVEALLRAESMLDWSRYGARFREGVAAHRTALRAAIADAGRVACLAASTKGNVLLQWCGLDSSRIVACAEVNEEKYGHVTPGTGIPILPDSEVRAMRPDAYLVLPWHFRRGIERREADYIAAGGRLIFPLPDVPVVVGGKVAA